MNRVAKTLSLLAVMFSTGCLRASAEIVGGQDSGPEKLWDAGELVHVAPWDGGDRIAYCADAGANSTDCPLDYCEFRCAEPGCFCVRRDCWDFDDSSCPSDLCQVMTDCSGAKRCTNLFTEPPPACGNATYYGQEVGCCPGLVKVCGAADPVSGVCATDRGGYNDFPWCMPCGNGACDRFETHCSCPADCP